MSLAREDRFGPQVEQRLRDFYNTLSEKDQRRFAALEAMRLPYGGQQYIAEVLGCSRRTIARGIDEFGDLHDGDPVEGRVRREGGGRPKKRRAVQA